MKTKSFILLTFTCLFILIMPSYNFPMYVGNYSEQSFNEDDPGTGTESKSITASSSLSIKELIIKSATYFFKSKSNIDLLTSKLEASDIEGVNFFELQIIINDALYYMRVSRYYYQNLKDKADNTPYNQTVIAQLIAFDYESFLTENSLNKDMFNQVKDYLKTGDVRGTYDCLYAYTNNIIDMLETVQKDIYYWNIPETKNVWKINQECAQMLLFGQYIAQIFQNLLS